MYRVNRNFATTAVCGVIGSYARYITRTSECENDKVETVFDVAIIGGGVVGLAVARACAVQTSAKTIIIESEDTVGAGTSSRNSGLGCTGYDSPVGTLERQLLRRSIRLHQNLYRSFGLSHQHVRKSGSLVVAWTTEELDKLSSVLQENRQAGIAEKTIDDVFSITFYNRR
jgi:glycerol-3-phosphate dehydrogenase